MAFHLQVSVLDALQQCIYVNRLGEHANSHALPYYHSLHSKPNDSTHCQISFKVKMVNFMPLPFAHSCMFHVKRLIMGIA